MFELLCYISYTHIHLYWLYSTAIFVCFITYIWHSPQKGTLPSFYLVGVCCVLSVPVIYYSDVAMMINASLNMVRLPPSLGDVTNGAKNNLASKWRHVLAVHSGLLVRPGIFHPITITRPHCFAININLFDIFTWESKWQLRVLLPWRYNMDVCCTLNQSICVMFLGHSWFHGNSSGLTGYPRIFFNIYLKKCFYHYYQASVFRLQKRSILN